MTTRWCPPLPSIGRAGPRIIVELSSTYASRLEAYYEEFRSVPDIFERRVSPRHQARALRSRNGARFLSEMTPAEQQSVLLRSLYYKASAAFRSRLRKKLDKNQLHQVRSWWHTATAAVLPLMISSVDEPSYAEVDHLIRWALENCANNYSHFQREFKTLKKRIRKEFALSGYIDNLKVSAHMLPYFRSCLKRQEFDSPAAYGRYVLLWTQTRATGVADSMMIRESLDKFQRTVTDPGVNVTLRPDIVRDMCVSAIATNGANAKVSVGTTSCLESTRRQGGKTAYLKHLASVKCVRAEYNFATLECEYITPRPVRSAIDLVHWAVYHLLHNRTYTSCVRVHAVSEPGKARTITVAPFAYQVVMGVMAHMFQPTLVSKHVRSGLRADRHLWRYLQQTLNPQNVSWDTLIENNVCALSTDLSEATDWGNLSVARQLWHGLISAANGPDFPLGLAVLAKSRYIGPRFFFVPDGNDNYRLVIRRRGWMMGDMMTKVILTLAHLYCCKKSGLTNYTLVGDDEIALDSDRQKLQNHLVTLSEIFKVSDDDTFVSSHFAFYCEEGTLLPQRASESNHVKMRRGKELDYLDYPRIRLLLPQIIETDAYSSTNIGRFALLGKEARWVDSVNTEAKRYFTIASLLQHILVPQDKDTLCPYTPLEIGGDGAFPHSGEFMRSVVDDKCINPREVKYRLSSLMNNKFSHKFVRSSRLDKVVHKHHLYLPKLEAMEKILPPESIIRPETDDARVMLQSTNFDQIATPQAIFFELAKGLYYKALLEGKDPPEPVFSINRSYTGNQTDDPFVDFHEFIDMWKNPGFKFQDFDGYFVNRDEIHTINPMNLGWKCDLTRYPKSREILNLWIKENVSFESQSLVDILDMIRTRRPLPKRVVDRLNLFIESDSYILHTLPRKCEKFVGIVTRDQKLCLRVLRALEGRGDMTHRVVMLDPSIYMVGRTEEVDNLRISGWETIPAGIAWITDPGAMLHVDYNEFTDGFPHREDIWDAPINVYVNRNNIVVVNC